MGTKNFEYPYSVQVSIKMTETGREPKEEALVIERVDTSWEAKAVVKAVAQAVKDTLAALEDD